MDDVAFGYLLLAIGILIVLGLVFAISLRAAGTGRGQGEAAMPPKPPRGVHLPPPSFLPSLLALGGGLLGAGLAFRGEEELANPFLAIPGVLLLIASVVGWVRAANREWTEVEQGAHGSHDDEAAESAH